MAEEKQMLRGIDWQETFSFTHMFRGFRLAIHPSKLVLAFVGLALCLIAGLVLDKLWYGGEPIIWKDGQPEEVKVFVSGGEESKNFSAWYDSQIETRKGNLERLRDRDLKMAADTLDISSPGVADKAIARMEVLFGEQLNDLKRKHNEEIDRIAKIDDEIKRVQMRDEANQQYLEDVLAARRGFQDEKQGVRDLVGTGPAGRGPFRAVLRYEVGVFNGLVSAAANLNMLGGIETTEGNRGPGVVVQIWQGLKGIQWLLWQHWVYFVISVVFCLVVWSIFGGAICRIAALHVARGEKISVKEALKFSIKKLPSFIFAPLIPLAIVAVLALLVVVFSLALGNLPWGIGEVLVAILFFLSLTAGFVMALVAVGTVGGLNLMYPTIAVEGSDSFDAISRLFNYVYARPWRMIFYSVVGLIYGVLCYLFVRFFAFLILKLTHLSVGAGIRVKGNSEIVNRFTTMWPGPQFMNLHGGFDWGACGGAQSFGAWVIALWVYVIIGFVAAFLVSFFLSANTLIYCLLRNKVDATDMDDVYVEEEPEEQTPAVPEESGQESASSEKPDEGRADKKTTSEGDT